MTRAELEALIYESYGVRADYPFEEDFVTGVFRHGEGGRWFALAMNISRSRLVPGEGGSADVVNLKCAPEIIESLVGSEGGIYRAYHMNKTHWLTACLEECDDELLTWLLGISFELTQKRIGKRRAPTN